jgi:hypothetical protein
MAKRVVISMQTLNGFSAKIRLRGQRRACLSQANNSPTIERASPSMPIEIPVEISRLLSEQSDRGVAIIGAAFLEYYLERLLLARMRTLSNKQHSRLFDGFGPPGLTLIKDRDRVRDESFW